MSNVRVGIIGVGGMGRHHAKYLAAGEVEGAELAAICDIEPDALKATKQVCRDDVKTFETAEALFEAKCVDAVMIATPHYDHPPLAIQAFESGLHVLSEKPAGVYTKQVREMNEAADAHAGRMFALMFQQRTVPMHQKLKELLEGGEIGEPKRNVWLITNWYRSQSYYDSGGWRATWAGEGGGVLVNQGPHNLDLWQWFCGMPTRVRAFCAFGKYHDIEVEDDVTAYVEYEDGSTGMFLTTTGETPGTNRFEVSGDRGKIVMEGGKLTFWRNRVPERRFNREYTGGFGQPENWKCEIPFGRGGGGHQEITQRWIQAIRNNDGSLMVADGREGIRSLMLSNAMLLSAWTDNWVDLPVDEDLFHDMLREKVKTSTFKKDTSATKTMDVDGTF